MIKYTSKDIVNRAEQLADLQNSDFISDSEKSALLNEAWDTLYQKIVNANDRTFIKTISAYDGMKLPKDFYQLSALYITKSKEQIERVNSSQLRGYNITNNILLLSHEYDDIEITLEYFPTPKTIFYNSGKKETRSFLVAPIVLLDDDIYLGSDSNLYSYSSDSQIGSFTDVMPCFLTGEAAAQSMAAALHLPVYFFSHQSGHLMAALYSSGATAALSGREFGAFHVSGGTTEMLAVHPSGTDFSVELLGSARRGLPPPCPPFWRVFAR